MNQRHLVGRRYEDYLKNDIFIELSEDEILWRHIYADARHQEIIDRRKTVRREAEIESAYFEILNSHSSFSFIDQWAHLL